MSFFSKFFKSEQKDEYFYSLVLRQDDGMGMLMHSNPAKKTIDIVEKRLFHYSSGWENIVYDVDELLFSSETDHRIKIEKIVYYVYGHLVDQHTKEIKETYAHHLKRVSAENDLKPIGYFEYNELIPAYIQHKEEIKLNAMLIEVDSPAISLFVYQGGKVVFAETVAKTENFVKDVETLLKKAKEMFVLPTRIIMYDSSKLEEESHALLTHKWSEKLFTQIPRVEVLPVSDIDAALVYGVQKEIFKSVAVSTFAQNNDQFEVRDDVADIDDSEINEKEIEEGSVAGFVIGQDIREMEQKALVDSEVMEEVVSNDLGALVDDYQPLDNIPYTQKNSPSNLFENIKRPHMSFVMPKNGLVPLAIVIILLAIVGSLFGLLYFTHKATLTILYRPDKINEKVSIDNLVTKKQAKTFTETASIKTTGSKEVGDKAKGQVTIYNALEEEQSLPSGTEFVGEDGGIFVLDKAISVKPATQTVTSDGDILTTTSKTDASLTARDIGPEFNIKNDVDLTIEGKSKKDIFAKTKAAFTGGTKDNMQAVSETDYETINDAVNEKLDAKAAETAKADANTSVIKDVTSIKVNDEKYSHEIGEEANELELSVEARVTYYTYNEDDLKKLLVQSFAKEVEGSQKLKPENIDYEITDAVIAEDEEAISIKVNAEAESSFELDETKLTESVKGKMRSDMRKILQGEFKTAGYEMKVDSALPFLSGVMPYFGRNITIQYKPI